MIEKIHNTIQIPANINQKTFAILFLFNKEKIKKNNTNIAINIFNNIKPFTFNYLHSNI